MIPRLLSWLDEPDGSCGIRYADDSEGWSFHSYEELAQLARAVAGQLVERGVAHDDAVAVIVPTGPLFVASFFGVVAAGATPVPLVPPSYVQSREEYAKTTARLLGAAASWVICDDAARDAVLEAAELAGMDHDRVVTPSGEDGAWDFDRRPPARTALLQFTSGSSGQPRGVRVSWDNLETNIAEIRDWMGWEKEDSAAVWLPMYHDMGLFGGLLFPTAFQRNMWVMRPEQFVQDPMRWLDCLGRRGAAYTAMPNFGFGYASKRLEPERLEGSDFSGWKGAVVGAERLDAGTIARFTRLLAPYGFRPEALLPAYGLAEATVAVTGVSLDAAPRAVKPRWSSLSLGEAVPLEATTRLGREDLEERHGWLMSSGVPLASLSVTLHDEHGSEVPEGCLGEIWVRGPSVTLGYQGSAQSSLTCFEGGVLRSGDSGFVVDGELFVIGRIGDAMKVRGRALYAEDLEASLAHLSDLPRGRYVVIPGPSEGQESLMLVVEGEPGPWVDEARWTLQTAVGQAMDVHVAVGPRGTIPRTSSGKPRRRVLWQQRLEARLDAYLIPIDQGASS